MTTSTVDTGGAEQYAPVSFRYLLHVSQTIRDNLNYPTQAKHNRIEGEAVVHIVLARDGTVLTAEVIRSAHNSDLDQEAREVVLRIHKFPELPDDAIPGQQSFAIDQPVQFHLG